MNERGEVQKRTEREIEVCRQRKRERKNAEAFKILGKE